MAECNECFHYEVCAKLIGKDKIDRVSWMCHFPDQCSEFKSTIPKTQADRIRAMSDEELAEAFSWKCLCDYIETHTSERCDKYSKCQDCVLEWLKQPAEDSL